MSLDVKKDPFYAMTIRVGGVGGREVHLRYITAGERIRAIQDFDADQCRAALALDDLQTTVRKALEARLRKLAKAMP